MAFVLVLAQLPRHAKWALKDSVESLDEGSKLRRGNRGANGVKDFVGVRKIALIKLAN